MRPGKIAGGFAAIYADCGGMFYSVGYPCNVFADDNDCDVYGIKVNQDMLLIIAISILFFYTIFGFKKPGAALITSPIVCGLLIYAAASFERFEFVVFAPAIIFATIIAVILSILLVRLKNSIKEHGT